MYQKELLKGNTETLLLSLLTNEPMHGYRIVKEIEKRSLEQECWEPALRPRIYGHRQEVQNQNRAQLDGVLR